MSHFTQYTTAFAYVRSAAHSSRIFEWKSATAHCFSERPWFSNTGFSKVTAIVQEKTRQIAATKKINSEKFGKKNSSNCSKHCNCRTEKWRHNITIWFHPWHKVKILDLFLQDQMIRAFKMNNPGNPGLNGLRGQLTPCHPNYQPIVILIWCRDLPIPTETFGQRPNFSPMIWFWPLQNSLHRLHHLHCLKDSPI